MLEFSSARNDIVGSTNAMADGVSRALEGLTGPADLITFHTTMGHDFKQLLAEAKRQCPDARVVGCTCGGVIGTDGASEKMRALAVMAVRGKGEFAVAHADAIRGSNSFEVAARVAADLKAQNGAINMIHIMASGIDIAADNAIAGIESVFGPDVPIFGGTSSDNMRAVASFQFVDATELERGILLVGYADPTLSLVTGVHHGNIPVGAPLVVTRADKNRVYELDGEPAWPRLMGALDLSVDTEISQTFAVASLGQPMPEALRADYDNGQVVHTIFLLDEERKSFYLPAAVEEGTQLSLMRRDEDLIFDGVRRMVKKLKSDLGERVPVAMFHTDCAARGKLMFNQILKDEIIASLQYPICEGAEIPWLGLYGFGEFTPVHGQNRFHTQTSSLYALIRE